MPDDTFKRWALKLAVVALILFGLVFWAVRRKGSPVVTPSPVKQLAHSSLPTPAIESVVFPQFLVENPQLRNDLLETTAVKTCVAPSLAKQPKLPEAPKDQTDLNALKQYRSDLVSWQGSWTTWWNTFQGDLKVCYNQNLQNTYGATSDQYSKYKWI